MNYATPAKAGGFNHPFLCIHSIGGFRLLFEFNIKTKELGIIDNASLRRPVQYQLGCNTFGEYLFLCRRQKNT